MWRSFVLCVFLGGRKRIGFGRTLCLMIRYPRIFAELCVWCEQFVNVWKKEPFSAKFSFADIFSTSAWDSSRKNGISGLSCR